MAGRYSLGVLAVLCVLLITLPAKAGDTVRKWSFERPGYGWQDNWVTDHVFLQKDGLWHVFYTRGYSPADPISAIGHAVSPNLRDWEQLPDAVAAVPQAPEWRRSYVWAPYVTEWPGGGYVMVFTGVNQSLSQQNGFLWSDDLVTWIELPEYPPVVPGVGIYYWRDDVDNDNRDPHLIQIDGLWHLIYSTRTQAGLAAVGHSTSPDLRNWAHHEPLLTVGSEWDMADLESPGLIEHDGGMILYYSRGGVRIQKGVDLYGPWSEAAARKIDFIGSGAEIFPSGDGLLLSRIRRSSCDMNRGALLCDSLDTNSWPFRILWLPGMVDFPYQTGSAFLAQPTFGDGPSSRGEPPSGHNGLYWLSSREAHLVPNLDLPCSNERGPVHVGELRSVPFSLEGDSLSAWVSGGTTSDSLRVAVCDVCTGEELARFVPDSPTLARQTAAVEGYRGRKVQWRVYDQLTRAGGWIGVDDLEESVRDALGPAPTAPAISWESPTGGETYPTGTNIKPNWSVSHPSGIDSAIVFISYDGGETLRRVGRRENGHPDFLPWPAPDTVAFGAQFRIVAYAHDGAMGCLDSAPFNINVTVDVGGIDIRGGLRARFRGHQIYLEGAVPAGSGPGEARLELFNVLGRRVGTPWSGRAGESFVVEVPATDEAGRRLASGVYFARLRHGGESWLARFVFLSGR
jgi:hypothetical protein